MQAVALATGQPAHLLLLVGALEVESGDVGAAVDPALSELDLLLAAGDLLPDRLLVVERVASLIDVGQPDALTDPQRSPVRLLLAGDQAQQRRLAGAVGADHPDDPAARKAEGELLEQHPLAVGLAQPLCLDHQLAQPRAGGNVDLHAVELEVGLPGEKRLVRVQPRLGLGPPGAGGGSHPLQLALDRAASRRLLARLLLEALALLLQPARVVAL